MSISFSSKHIIILRRRERVYTTRTTSRRARPWQTKSLEDKNNKRHKGYMLWSFIYHSLFGPIPNILHGAFETRPRYLKGSDLHSNLVVEISSTHSMDIW